MLYTKFCTHNHKLSKIRIFLALNVSLSENIVTACLQRFFKFHSADKKMGKKVKLSIFQLKTFFKYSCLSDVASAQQNILRSQLCLHTLIQTRLSANESVRTIFII